MTEYTVPEGGESSIFAVVVTVTPAPDEPIEVTVNIIGDTAEGISIYICISVYMWCRMHGPGINLSTHISSPLSPSLFLLSEW